MRYKKAPILEAVLAFRWSDEVSLDELSSVLAGSDFESFEKPKPRMLVGAQINVGAGEVSPQKTQLGFEAVTRDGTEVIFLERTQFVFVQKAPYDRWESFSSKAISLLGAVTSALGTKEFNRVGLRYINRIDVPTTDGTINTDDYVTVSFDGPREDKGVIHEFQMRVVKPSERDGIHYALVLATTASPLPNFSSILLDIDVFKNARVPVADELEDLLNEMRAEKNEIFEECVTDNSRALFGGSDK